MTPILSIAISIVVIYLVFSVIVYVAVEWIAGLAELRGRMLRTAIYDAFNDNMNKDFGALIYSHPQVECLKQTSDKLPAYLPGTNVAVALIDLVAKNASPDLYALRDDKTLEQIKNDVTDLYGQFNAGMRILNESHFKTLLLSLANQAVDLESLKKTLIEWYDNYMDRVTGWYKRKIRVFIMLMAVVVTLLFNVDSIYILKAVSNDPELRTRLNTLADNVLKDSVIINEVHQQRSGLKIPVSDTSHTSNDSLLTAYVKQRQQVLTELKQRINETGLPVGWVPDKGQFGIWKLLRWVISILALSAGAPFWFDILKSLVNVRNTGIKPGVLIPKN